MHTATLRVASARVAPADEDGRTGLGNNLINLGIFGDAEQAVAELGLDLHALLNEEPEPGLRNGGLGRLAACFFDSMAALEIPSLGYGIRYEFGIFDQEIVDGWQVERTDKWLRFGNPWELVRPEWAKEVKFGGKSSNSSTRWAMLSTVIRPSRAASGLYSYRDPYMVMADYAGYAHCQDRVGRACGDSSAWPRMSILNTARSGKFSSDRSIREYCEDIWNVTPKPIRLLTPEEVKAGGLQ